MEHVYASIDIGSDAIKLVVCELYNGNLNLLAASSVPSKGVKRGLIINPELAKESIEKAFAEVKSMLGFEIKKVLATISLYKAEHKIVKSACEVKNNIITANEINTLYERAVKCNKVLNMELITLFPIDFTIDDKTRVIDPKGKSGSRLSARWMMLLSPKKNIYSVASILEQMGIEVVDISVSSIGNLCLNKHKSNRDGIGFIVDIGSDTTTISLYNKKIPIASKIITMGGRDIDSDISFMYKINIEEAKKIKHRFVRCSKKFINPDEYYENTNNDGDIVRINQAEVSEIATSRMEEIISLVKNEINLLTNKPIQYIILTGGSSNLKDLHRFTSEILDSKTEIEEIEIIGARDNKYSVALGNIIYFIDNLKLRGQNYTMLEKDDMEVLSSPDKHFIDTSNETMLGKVFGYFFGE